MTAQTTTAPSFPGGASSSSDKRTRKSTGLQYDLEPKHGTVMRYKKMKCKCDACTHANTLWMTKYKIDLAEGRPRTYPVCGAQRRLQALQWLGWEFSYIGKLAQITPTMTWSITTGRQKRVSASVHDRIDHVFEQLCMIHAPVTAGSTKARERARRNGWAPPLAWEDIDDPDCLPDPEIIEPPFTQTRPSRRGTSS